MAGYENSVLSDIVCIQRESKEDIPEGITAFRYNNYSCEKIFLVSPS